MTQHTAKHSGEVVEQFRAMIGPEAAAAIDDEHFQELAIMIESAIDTAVLMRLEPIASELAALAERVRHNAESSLSVE